MTRVRERWIPVGVSLRKLLGAANAVVSLGHATDHVRRGCQRWSQPALFAGWARASRTPPDRHLAGSALALVTDIRPKFPRDYRDPTPKARCLSPISPRNTALDAPPSTASSTDPNQTTRRSRPHPPADTDNAEMEAGRSFRSPGPYRNCLLFERSGNPRPDFFYKELQNLPRAPSARISAPRP